MVYEMNIDFCHNAEDWLWANNIPRELWPKFKKDVGHEIHNGNKIKAKVWVFINVHKNKQ